MKYLIIHNEYSTPGGEERVVEAQIKLLSGAGHTVHTYIRRHQEVKTWRLGRVQSLFTALFSPRSRREVSDLVREFKPDVAIIHNLYPVISPSILPILRKNGTRILMTVHNYRLACPTGLFLAKGKICEKCTSGLRELHCITNKCEGSAAGSIAYALRNFWARKMKYFVNNVDSFLVLSQFQAAKLMQVKVPKEKIEIVPNFIFTPKELNVIPSREDGFVGFVGRMSREKGADVFCKIAEKLPLVKFKIAGDIPENITLKLPENVELVGFLDQKQLQGFYENSALIVSTSICYEGFSMVALESSANGRAFVAPNIGAFPDLVNRNCLYAMGDIDDAAQIIARLLGDNVLRQQIESEQRDFTLRNFNETKYLEQLEKHSSL